MSDARYRTAKAKILVISPGEKPEMKPVTLFYDRNNDAYGIMVHDGPLAGFVIEASRVLCEKIRESGRPAEDLVT